MTEILSSVEECVDRAIAAVGKAVVLGAPLGLGKPVQLLNAFYHRAAADPTISLHIVTALFLEVPRAGSAVEAPSWSACLATMRSWRFSRPIMRVRCP
jgi:hypothetical protein